MTRQGNVTPDCPFDDGRHQPFPWVSEDHRRSGLSCRRCHKTWEWIRQELVPTRELHSMKA